MRTMLAVTMAAVLMAAPALAQEMPMEARPAMMEMMHGQGDMMGMMDGMMDGMAMADGPEFILKLKESLELSETQVQRLMAIQEASQSSMRQHMMPGMHGMQSAMKLLEAPAPNLAAYEAELRKAADHMVLAHTAMARAGVEARQVLTAAQRDRLTFARKMMMEMNAHR